jgi:type IV pilus assembly protein PilY1
MISTTLKKRLVFAIVKLLVLGTSGLASAASLSIVDVPLFLSGNVAPLNMLVLGRDHKLFYEAYADHSDLDGDGTLDIGYRGFDLKPDNTFKIDYYGYFDSYKCYTHDGAKFVPSSINTNKRCSGAWSGDWLNWVTTTRIDALRKVLYGGKRVTDTTALTILERAHVPQDAHSWGKEYSNSDGYLISDVAPYTAPPAGQRHFFSNTTLMLNDGNWTGNNEPPLLRVLLNQPATRRVWHWVSKESPVAGASINEGAGNVTVAPSDFIVRVQVCATVVLKEDNCRDYPTGTVQKPTGLLQDFGESDSMLFGLLSGSYARSKSGGVIRKDVSSIKDELNWQTDGTLTNVVGIMKTMDRFRMPGYEDYTGNAGGRGTFYLPGLVTNRPFNEGEFGGNWGNPVGEMMFEALRYFSQRTGTASSLLPTGVFDYAAGFDVDLTLPKVSTWSNPYGAGKPFCAKPFMTVMSDVNTSYDSDQLPGANWTGLASDLPGSLNVASVGTTIWNNEIGAAGTYFIGQSGATYDGAPTGKAVSSFSNIRGLSPEEPTKEGSYYSASVAYHGAITDLNTVAGQQKAQTFAVALASPLPRIEIPVNGRNVTIIPFAKSVGTNGINGNRGQFQPTNQIVDFYIESIAADRTSGTFQVNFEDVEAGNDHDMDAVARYNYVVNADNTLTVTVNSDYAAGGIVQHMGYVISGTTRDGIYLEVRDSDTNDDQNFDYFLDTPHAFVGTPPAPDTGAGTWDDNVALPLTHSRTFTTVGASTSADVLKDPLWYAAKWGGFKDGNANNLPDQTDEWDEDNNGVPDNYYLVTNALTLADRLGEAFREVARRQGSASSASVNTGSISSDTRVYQAKFSSGDWTGQLLSFPVITVDNPVTPVNEIGTLAPAEWNGWEQMNTQSSASRVIITTTTAGTGVPFLWGSLDPARQALLQPNDSGVMRGAQRVDYLRGDATALEQRLGGVFRDRVTPDPTDAVPPIAMLPNKLGDIVSSSPIFVGVPPFAYPDALESDPYSSFVAAKANRPKMVYVGANDGMLHGFDAGAGATKGQEKLAFIPSAVFRNLHELTRPNYNYNHKFFVDGTPTMGDVFYGGAWHTVLVGGLNKGGQGIYALDITNPGTDFTAGNADNIHLWEFDDTDDVDMGFTYSRPAIAKMANGRWAAIFGNGYNNSTTSTGDTAASTTGRAYLFIVDIETGSVISKIDTVAGSVGTPNGLATPAVVDINGDSVADYIYAGDLLGNMWKFNVRATNPASWASTYGTVAAPVPLFVARDGASARQPITSKPEVSRGPKGVGMMVLFGTGKFLEPIDKAPTQTQTFYGIHDKNTGDITQDGNTGRGAQLRSQTITFEGNLTFGTQTVSTRLTSANAMTATHRGWYMDLLSPVSVFRGEMQVSNSVLRNGRIVFTTLIPDSDPCGNGGTSWLMEMDALSGQRLAEPPFDMNNDGLFTSDDATGIAGDGSTYNVSPSGRQSTVGITQGPGILFDPGTGATGGKEYKYLSGSSESAPGVNLQQIVENPGPNSTGRQSWRQVK